MSDERRFAKSRPLVLSCFICSQKGASLRSLELRHSYPTRLVSAGTGTFGSKLFPQPTARTRGRGSGDGCERLDAAMCYRGMSVPNWHVRLACSQRGSRRVDMVAWDEAAVAKRVRWDQPRPVPEMSRWPLLRPPANDIGDAGNRSNRFSPNWIHARCEAKHNRIASGRRDRQRSIGVDERQPMGRGWEGSGGCPEGKGTIWCARS